MAMVLSKILWVATEGLSGRILDENTIVVEAKTRHIVCGQLAMGQSEGWRNDREDKFKAHLNTSVTIESYVGIFLCRTVFIG